MSTTRTGLFARAVTVVAAGAALVVAPGLATSAAAADAPTSTSERAGLAGSFIAATLVDGDHYTYPSSTYPDGGNTIDAVLALDGARVGSGTADAAMAFLASIVGQYTGTDYASTYAGATAKMLLAVVAHGGDPASFGGADLVAQLQATYGAAEPGRYSDLPATGCGYDPCDYSSTISQSLAIIGLDRAGSPAPGEATTLLLAQQCADGGFREAIGGDTCVSDPDSTAFAVQALLATGTTTEAGSALDYLTGVQGPAGGLAGAGNPVNANTTGLAVQAFLAGGRTAAAAAGQAFLASLQYDCTAAEALRWGLAYDDTTRSATSPSDTDLRATPQAALALAGGSLLSVSSEGSSTQLPAFACPTPTTSSPTTSTTSPGSGSTTSSGSATTTSTPATSRSASSASASASASGTVGAAAGGSDPSASSTVAGAAAGPASLAQTGSNLLVPVLVGLALLVVGALAVWGSRRRGTHA